MSYFVQVHKVAMQVLRITQLWPNTHLHPQLELICLEEGSCEAVVDHRRYRVEAGQILTVFPNQLHAYFEKTPAKGYVVILTAELFPELHELLQGKLPKDPVISTESTGMDVTKLLANIRSKLKQGSALGETVAKGWLLALLGEICSQMDFADKSGEAATVKRILHYCMEHYTEPFTLEDMARDLYVSKYYICHVFRQRFNTSLKEFVNQLRLEAACAELKKGTPITESAYASGFSSLRTFNRIFGNYMGMTPREYAKLNQ